MKYAAIVMVIVLVASVCGVGWLYMTANVHIEALGVTALEAAAQPETFSALVRQTEGHALTGTVFSADDLRSAEHYQFLTFSVRLRNDCFLPADMVEVQITPMEGDVLQLGSDGAKMLPAQSTGDITTTILTDISMHSVREIVVTYYMWGMPFSVKATSYAKQ